MKHLVSLAAALLTAGTLVAATTTAHAQTPAQGYYVAVPLAPSARTSLVTRTAAWRAQNGAFVANQAPERAEILCRLVADRTGALASFSAHGEAFDADRLATCNAHATRAAGQTAALAK